MTDSTDQTSSADLAADPDYQALGNSGNPFSGDGASKSDTGTGPDAAIDHTPDAQAADGSAENPPLPDWGPTDGEHGVDGSDPTA